MADQPNGYLSLQYVELVSSHARIDLRVFDFDRHHELCSGVHFACKLGADAVRFGSGSVRLRIAQTFTS